jgi:hypothetical protein
LAPRELRFRIAPGIMGKLDELQQYWGHRSRGSAIESAILECHTRHLSRTGWEQQRAHAYRVLKRLKPELLLSIDEIVSVGFIEGGDWVTIGVALNAQPYKVSREKWER